MKTMTCRQLGGTCDETFSTNSVEEMKNRGLAHGEEAHPEVIERINKMSPEEKEEFDARIQAQWDAAPEDDEEEKA